MREATDGRKPRFVATVLAEDGGDWAGVAVIRGGEKGVDPLEDLGAAE